MSSLMVWRVIINRHFSGFLKKRIQIVIDIGLEK